MKKYLFLFFVTITLSGHAEFFMGPQLGLNVATLNKTSYTVNNKLGWHGGFYASFPLGNHFSIMPAILYSTKGFKYDYTTTTTSYPSSGNPDTAVVNLTANVNATLGYLDFPILLTIFSGKSKGLMIQAGPQFSYLITNTTTLSTSTTVAINGGSSQPTNPDPNNKLDFHKSDISLVGGLAYRLPKLLMIYARATTGLLKVQQGTLVKDDNYGRHFVIEIGAGLVF